MRRPIIVLALTALAPGGAAAQAPWTPEIGIQGGYIRLKPAGTGQADQIDLYDIPGANFLDVVPAYGSVFAIIPVRGRFALEPTLRFSQTTSNLFPFAFTLGTTATLGLRGDYALTRRAYVAAGGVLTYVEAGGVDERQLGVQAALGYRLAVSGRLRFRVEAQWTTMANADQAGIGPHNDYALLFGVATPVGSKPATPSQSRPGARRAWRRVVGIQAGYTRFHLVGGGDLSLVTFPGAGASGVGGVFAPGPPTLFAIVPVGGGFGVELGLDAHQFQSNGTTFLSGQLAPRLNYAVGGGWYAAAGGNLHVLRASDVKLSAVSGGTVATGYRLPLTGTLGGRIELNYTVYQAHHSLQQPAANSLGIMFATTVPLK